MRCVYLLKKRNALKEFKPFQERLVLGACLNNAHRIDLVYVKQIALFHSCRSGSLLIQSGYFLRCQGFHVLLCVVPLLVEHVAAIGFGSSSY